MMSTCVACGFVSGPVNNPWPGLRECGLCGHRWADLDIDQIDYKRLYGEGYFSGEEYVDYVKDRAILERQFVDRLRDIGRLVPAGSRMIEVGCAYGFFSSRAREIYRVTGFDISADAIRYAREQLLLDARCEDFVSASIPRATVDTVVMWDTIEHLPRPDCVIEKASSVLAPGAWLFLTTGDAGSVAARVRKDKWRLFHPPTHLHYFTRHSVSKLLSRHGIETVSVTYVSVRRSLRQVAYSLLLLGRPDASSLRSRLYSIIDRTRFGEMSFAINTRDIMMVVGRKCG